MHCDAELDPDLLRWVAGGELERVGYAVWRERETAAVRTAAAAAAGGAERL